MNKNIGPWLALSNEWFTRHQRVLLWLLNAPIIGWWFRWVLSISMSDVWLPRSTHIIEIGPSYYKVQLPTGEYRLDARTHPKYSKRLYFAFKPFWWTLHYWDALVADKWAPQLSFGFLTLTAYPDPDPETATVDGYMYRTGSNLTWADIRDGAGSAEVSANVNVWCTYFDGNTTGWDLLVRSIVLFDTSALGAGATITAATLSVLGKGKTDPAGRAPDADVYTSTPASNTALAAGDYQQIGTTSQTGSPITYANWSTTLYNDWAFNATGLGNISTTGVSRFGLRNANYDVANVEPAIGNSDSYLQGASADTAGTTSDPKLVVTYTAGATLGGPLVGGQLANSSLLIGGRLVQQ